MKANCGCTLASTLKENPPRSVLVMRPGAMGDVLLTTPALRALRRGFPDARISVLVTKSGKAILKGSTSVDEILVLDKSSLRSQASAISVVRSKKFDLVIDFLCNPRTALISIFSGARLRLGYDVRMRKYAYNLRKSRDEYAEGQKVAKYAAQVNIDMLGCLGIESTDIGLDFLISDAARSGASEFLRAHSLDEKKVIGICPAGTWQSKTWELEKFAGLADRIVRDLGHRILILWGPGERELAQRMLRLMSADGVLAGETDIDQVGALIQRCALFVSNDSGLKHIAVAVDTPTVTIFGPTNPKTWNPNGAKHKAVHADLSCLFCDKNECAERLCMKELGVEKVFSVIKEVLESISQRGVMSDDPGDGRAVGNAFPPLDRHVSGVSHRPERGDLLGEAS